MNAVLWQSSTVFYSLLGVECSEQLIAKCEHKSIPNEHKLHDFNVIISNYNYYQLIKCFLNSFIINSDQIVERVLSGS